jgi:hypothetical protein
MTIVHHGPDGPEEPEGEIPDDEDDEIGPDDPDYDLSEAHGYTWEPEREEEGGPFPPWLMVTITVLVIAGLVLPSLLIVMYYR